MSEFSEDIYTEPESVDSDASMLPAFQTSARNLVRSTLFDSLLDMMC